MNESTKQTIEYVLMKLQTAASALEPGAKHVYEVLVRQTFVEGLVQVLGGFLLLLLPIVFYLFWYKRFSTWAGNGSPSEDRDMVEFFVHLGLVAVSAIGFIVTGQALPDVLNPEYGAIKFLLKQ